MGISQTFHPERKISWQASTTKLHICQKILRPVFTHSSHILYNRLPFDRIYMGHCEGNGDSGITRLKCTMLTTLKAQLRVFGAIPVSNTGAYGMLAMV